MVVGAGIANCKNKNFILAYEMDSSQPLTSALTEKKWILTNFATPVTISSVAYITQPTTAIVGLSIDPSNFNIIFLTLTIGLAGTVSPFTLQKVPGNFISAKLVSRGSIFDLHMFGSV